MSASVGVASVTGRDDVVDDSLLRGIFEHFDVLSLLGVSLSIFVDDGVLPGVANLSCFFHDKLLKFLSTCSEEFHFLLPGTIGNEHRPMQVFDFFPMCHSECVLDFVCICHN